MDVAEVLRYLTFFSVAIASIAIFFIIVLDVASLNDRFYRLLGFLKTLTFGAVVSAAFFGIVLRLLWRYYSSL